jgi:hypothetical protein
MQTRRRSIPFKGGSGTLTVETVPVNPNVPPSTSVLRTDWRDDRLNGTQVTASENHPAWRTRQKEGLMGDIGGDFTSVKKYVAWSPTPHVFEGKSADSSGNLTYKKYEGFLAASTLTGRNFPSVLQSNEIGLNAWGAKAIAKCKPANAPVDLSVSLGELLQPGGIPRAFSSFERWKGVIDQCRKAGSDYLNVVYGWRPVVNDVLEVSNTILMARAFLKQYERDAGKVVRRRWSFEPVIVESTEYTGLNPTQFWWSPSAAGLDNPTGRVVRTQRQSVKRWFSGAFTYYLPTGYNSRNRAIEIANQADQLLGITITPETLWNLTPWSWAADWVTNMGDVVSNIKSFGQDGLVMRYGYLMEHTLHEDEYVGIVTKGRGMPDRIALVTETKVRRRANPYGFGVTWNGLSPLQISILAALGISRR